MANKTNFFVVSLIAMMAVAPAVADTPATQEWTKKRYDTAMQTINTRLATAVRDKIYTYDSDKQSATYGQPLDPLHTEAETAFSGINEVLEKVDGNDGTANSAVTLETTAQNAFGAINELKGDIEAINVPTKTSDLTNDSGFLTQHQSLEGYALSSEVPTKTSDLTNDSGFLTQHQSLEGYATTSDMNTALADKADANIIGEGFTTTNTVAAALNGKQGTISDLSDIRSGAAAGATAVQPGTLTTTLADYATTSDMNTALADKADADIIGSGFDTTNTVAAALAGKQATIGDLSDIRSGAAAGATAVQPGALETALADYTTTADLTTELAAKADASDLTALTTRVGTAEGTIGTGAMTVNGANQATIVAAINALDTKTNGMATDQNLTDLQNNVTTLATTVGNTSLTTTAQTVTGAVNELNTAVGGKQDTISDIATIRSGAALGATAVQDEDLAAVATSGDYDDLINKPTMPTVDNALNAQSSNAIANSAVASKLVSTAPGSGEYVLGYVNGTPTYIAVVGAE